MNEFAAEFEIFAFSTLETEYQQFPHMGLYPRELRFRKADKENLR